MNPSQREHLVRIPLRAKPAGESAATVQVYKPFFLAGILCVLTAGCALGAVALLGIARAGSHVIGMMVRKEVARAT